MKASRSTCSNEGNIARFEYDGTRLILGIDQARSQYVRSTDLDHWDHSQRKDRLPLLNPFFRRILKVSKAVRV